MDERKEGNKAAGLIGKVCKVDVDEHGKASDTYFRARVEIPIEKPLKRFITLENEKVDEYYDIQYEKLPFFCHSCGIMGHSKLECPNPMDRDANGNQEYNNSIRAPEERKKKF
jgi:hypothetical protein